MKKLFLLLSLITATCFAIHYQTGGTIASLAPGAHTTLANQVIAVGGNNLSVTVSFTEISANPNSGDVTFFIDKSLDLVNWETNHTSITLASKSTNTACVVTNFSVGAVPYWRVGTIVNGSTNTITNLTILATWKDSL
jgi:hypothetical protein